MAALLAAACGSDPGLNADIDASLDDAAGSATPEGGAGGDADDLADAAGPETGDSADGAAPEDAATPDDDGASVRLTAALRAQSLDPEHGSFRGGELVAVHGDGLLQATAARFGDQLAEIVSQSEGVLEVRTPRVSAAGAVTVRVDAADGAAFAPPFEYVGIPPPQLRFVERLPMAEGPAAWAIEPLRGLDEPRVVVVTQTALALARPQLDSVVATVWADDVLLGAPRAHCVADFDGDGLDDLWLATADGSYGAWRQSATGLLAPPSTEPLAVSRVACGDLDGDGAADVVVALAPPGGLPALRVLRGDGEGGFTALGDGIPLSAPAESLAVGDVDGDGLADVLVTRQGGAPRLLFGGGAAGLIEASPGALPSGGQGASVALGDLNRDGRYDAVLVEPDGLRIWFGGGAGLVEGHWVPRPAAAPRAIRLVDLDHDGWLDVLLATSGDAGLQIFRLSAGALPFSYSHAVLALPHRGAALGPAAALDVDDDGDLDLVVGRPEGLVILQSWDPLPFADTDGDGVPDLVDGCPLHYDPAQRNVDRWHFACESAAECEAETGCALWPRPGERAWLACPDAAPDQLAARVFCHQRGGTLARVDSADALEAALELGAGRYWIDLYVDTSMGAFLTADGAPAPYVAWGPEALELGEGAPRCVELVALDDTPYFAQRECDGPGIQILCEDVAWHAEADPPDACDVCPLVHDPDQLDTTQDGVGDACQPDPPAPAALGQPEGDEPGDDTAASEGAP